MEGIATERNELAKVVVDLEVQVKEWGSRLEESELRAASKELEEELTMYKNKAME